MNDFKWTERHVATAVAHWFDYRANIVLPNYSNGLTRAGYEADLVVVRPSGWADEVEIKVSLADYRAEFRSKPKRHRILQEGKPTFHCKPYRMEGPGAMSEWLEVSARPEFIGETGHNGEITHGYDWGETTPHMCRRFWFAMPSELAERLASEIPTYAGILTVKTTEYGLDTRKLREAPILKHSQKIDSETRAHIMQCAYHRFWDTRPLSGEKQTA